MSTRVLAFFICSLFFSGHLSSQYVDGVDTLYGNEWIDFDKEYFKIRLFEDGVYQLTRAELLEAGFAVDKIPMEQLVLMHNGKQVPIYTSTKDIMGADDYLEFYGEQNRNKIDKYYFSKETDQLNPEYSLIPDTSAYFLSFTTDDEVLRYKEVNTDLNITNLPQKEAFYMHEEKLVYGSRYFKSISSGLRYSTGMTMEGYGLSYRKRVDIKFPVTELNVSGPMATIFCRFGGNAIQHQVELLVNNTSLKEVEFPGYGVVEEAASVDLSDLTAETTLSLVPKASSKERLAFAFGTLTYPRNFKFNGANSVDLNFESDNNLRYLELSDYNTAAGGIRVYDLSTGTRIIPVIDNGLVKLTIDESNHSLKLVNTESTKKVLSITSLKFEKYNDLNPDYIIMTNSLLSHGEGNYVQAYADYRSSSAGGNFKPIVLDVQNIYDQFGYGVHNHFLALKSFYSYALKHWKDLKYNFIIGNTIEYHSQRNYLGDKSNYIPTYGFPGSDNLLVGNENNRVPRISTGRLAATTSEHVQTYLNKIKEHESTLINIDEKDRLWTKRVIHLGGGDPKIQNFIKTKLNKMGNIIEDGSFGGNVTSFFKKSSEPIQNSRAESLREQINQGVSLLTFFGHSAIGVFDYNLENVKKYSNKGRYNILFSMGCYSGNIHTSNFGLSEQFVLEPEKGSIAFIAATSQAGVGVQGDLGEALYKQYNVTEELRLGDAIRKALISKMSNSYIGWVSLLQQLTLHGDPATLVHTYETPDYTPEFGSVKTVPEVVNVYQDSFKLCFDVLNLGSNLDTILDIRVQHFGPSNTVVHDTIFNRKAPSFTSNYCIQIPVGSTKLVGKNAITVEVDASNSINEGGTGEQNNHLNDNKGSNRYEFYILNNSAMPISPKKFSIYTDNEVILQASSFNALDKKENYKFQLDTVSSFDSPALQEYVSAPSTGLIQWKPSFDFEKSKVYYWRISPDISQTNTSYIWESSSFIYEPSFLPGWNQSHFGQHAGNSLNDMVFNNGELDFVSNFQDFTVKNVVRVGEDFPYLNINGAGWSNYAFWKPPSLCFVIIGKDGKRKRNLKVPGATQMNIGKIFNHFYAHDQNARINMVNYLVDEVEDGDYVLFYTNHKQGDYNQDFKSSEWAADSIVNNGRNIFNVMKAQGAQYIDDFRTEKVVPYNFFYKKNEKPLVEDRAENMKGKIESTVPIYGKWDRGSIVSEKVGPVTKWSSVGWDLEIDSLTEEEKAYLNVYRYDVNGVKDIYLKEQVEGEIDLSGLDASQYPYIQLEYYAEDPVEYSVPRLNYWRVFYESDMVELALDPNAEDAYFKSDTLFQGQDLELQIPLRLVAGEIKDSIDVKIDLINDQNVSTSFVQKVPPMKLNESSMIRFSQKTKTMRGTNTLALNANTNKSPQECFYFNNFALKNFYIQEDRKNPLMDVRFDGVEIMNGDIVSGKPFIRVAMQDENKFLLLSDSSAYELVLHYPDKTNEEISMSDPRISFIPAKDLNDNRCEIHFRPEFLQEGIHSLEVVSFDRSGNASGSSAYKIDFNVIQKQMISNMYNYPNPFSDCTQFVFTLTGNTLPDEFGIRIMTVTGKVVREISASELGPIHIGLNRTSFKWCGTDEFGQRLANGVYLYQVKATNSEGESLDQWETPNTKQFFKHNIGKLVIMR